MAITIRDTDKHEVMLSELKELTRTSTMSKALLQGGYDALKYHNMYREEERENQRLRSELYDLKCKVGDFLNSYESLKEAAE